MHFRAGMNEVSFTVSIHDERLVELDEEFYIELEIPPSAAASCSVVKASPDNATVIIQDIGRIDREQIRSRINNNDCRTFRPRRPLSTAYRTKETAV